MNVDDCDEAGQKDE